MSVWQRLTDTCWHVAAFTLVLGVGGVVADAVIPASQTMCLLDVWVHDDLTAAQWRQRPTCQRTASRQSPGSADLERGDFNHWFTSSDFFVKKIAKIACILWMVPDILHKQSSTILYCLKLFLYSFIHSLSVRLRQQLVSLFWTHYNTHCLRQSHTVYELRVPGSTDKLRWCKMYTECSNLITFHWFRNVYRKTSLVDLSRPDYAVLSELLVVHMMRIHSQHQLMMPPLQDRIFLLFL